MHARHADNKDQIYMAISQYPEVLQYLSVTQLFMNILWRLFKLAS
jgi:hypothetical protein